MKASHVHGEHWLAFKVNSRMAGRDATANERIIIGAIPEPARIPNHHNIFNGIEGAQVVRDVSCVQREDAKLLALKRCLLLKNHESDCGQIDGGVGMDGPCRFGKRQGEIYMPRYGPPGCRRVKLVKLDFG